MDFGFVGLVVGLLSLSLGANTYVWRALSKRIDEVDERYDELYNILQQISRDQQVILQKLAYLNGGTGKPFQPVN